MNSRKAFFTVMLSAAASANLLTNGMAYSSNTLSSTTIAFDGNIAVPFTLTEST